MILSYLLFWVIKGMIVRSVYKEKEKICVSHKHFSHRLCVFIGVTFSHFSMIGIGQTHRRSINPVRNKTPGINYHSIGIAYMFKKKSLITLFG